MNEMDESPRILLDYHYELKEWYTVSWIRNSIASKLILQELLKNYYK